MQIHKKFGAFYEEHDEKQGSGLIDIYNKYKNQTRCTHANSYMHIHTHVHTHKQIKTYTDMYVCTHTHTHTHF